MTSSADTQMLSPESLANQLFDAALAQFPASPREAAKHVITFLAEALVYAVSETAGNEDLRKTSLKNVGDMIASAPARQGKIPK